MATDAGGKRIGGGYVWNGGKTETETGTVTERKRKGGGRVVESVRALIKVSIDEIWVKETRKKTKTRTRRGTRASFYTCVRCLVPNCGAIVESKVEASTGVVSTST